MLVAGEWTEARSGGMFEVTNPANGDVIQEIPDGGREEAARAIDAAYEVTSRLGRRDGIRPLRHSLPRLAVDDRT